MSTMQEVAPATDQKVLDELQPIVAQLSSAGREKLLAILARDSLNATKFDVPLTNDQGSVFAYIRSTERPVLDLASQFTEEELKTIERNLFDPKQHMTVQEMLAQLDAEDDRRVPA